MKTLLAALLLVGFSACDPMGPMGPMVEPKDAGPCCVHYEAGSQVSGCWMCSGQLRCVGTECAVGSTSMPLCLKQPAEPYMASGPSCE
jgi:hypothetical protein